MAAAVRQHAAQPAGHRRIDYTTIIWYCSGGASISQQPTIGTRCTFLNTALHFGHIYGPSITFLNTDLHFTYLEFTLFGSSRVRLYI
jgi:hypothetical protein